MNHHWRHHWRIVAIAAASAAFTVASSTAFAAMSCGDVTTQAFNIPGATIDSAEAVAKGEDAPVAHCLVRGTTAKRTGVDGKDYAIAFELRLPDDWNHRFVHQFNGGNDGAVVPAFGPLLGGDKSATALARGYAVVSSDAGHSGEANPDAGLAGGARFGFDPVARDDYGYAAVAKLNPVALQMVEAYYGGKIAYSYGVGGSNGGRHAMVAAARMPQAFDGLLIGYPGFNLPKAAVQHPWDVQAFAAVNGDVRKAFSPDDLALVSKAILESCDAMDGVADGLVQDTRACQKAFDIESLTCADGQNSACLSAAQVAALEKTHQGPHNSKGEQLYSSWDWDSGISSGDWRFWKLESPIPPWDHLPLIATMGSASLAQIFTTPPTEVGGTPADLESYLLNFDFDKDAPKIFAKADGFTESAMDFMTPPGADNPDLAPFRDAGHKLIVFHGVSDPVFSVVDTTNWYEKLDANNGGNAESFAMFYRVPGMNHGAAGPTTDDFDFFSPLTEWVENGKAPNEVIAGVTSGNAEGQAALGDIKRPLCPYPRIARYTGSDPASAESFTCE